MKIGDKVHLIIGKDVVISKTGTVTDIQTNCFEVRWDSLSPSYSYHKNELIKVDDYMNEHPEEYI